MALARGFASDREAVGGGAEINILRLHIYRVGINAGSHRRQIIDIGGQRTADIHLAAQMAKMLTGGAATAIIRADLVAGLYRIQQPVAARIDLKILADIEARALLDKVTLGTDHRVIADIDARQWPQNRLVAQHRAIIATELLAAGAQYQITPAVQLQVGSIYPRAGQVNITVQCTEQHIIARLKQAAPIIQCNVLRHADAQIVGGFNRPRIAEALHIG
ncbi:Uncharacterised protein [Yersinia enterocolitica]|nr:Uncharacterised protein [Yersinia enterocolitica]